MNEFDLKAAGWEKDPKHWERSEAIANEIKKLIPLNKTMAALEYGAGTGIASFILKDYLKEITLMDNSIEMVKVMNNKIKTSKADNLNAIYFDLEQEDFLVNKFDLIFSQMVLHHITDVENIILKFHNLLNPGGFLAIADLYPEDGSFHGDAFTGQKGFDPEKMSKWLSRHGFRNISHSKCYVLNKRVSDTEIKEFDIFLLIANRDLI